MVGTCEGRFGQPMGLRLLTSIAHPGVLPRSPGWFLLFSVAASVLFLTPGSGVGQIRPIELEGFVISGTPVPRTASSVTLMRPALPSSPVTV